MKYLRKLPLAACALPFLVGCSGDSVTVVAGSPVIPEAPSSAELAAPATLGRLSASGSAVLVGSDAGLLALNETSLAAVDLVAYQGEPAETGAIHALTARGAGVLVVADGGVYHSYGDRLVRSPASDVMAGVEVFSLDNLTVDGVERSWFGSDGAVYQLEGDSLRRWELGAEGPVNALRESGGRLLAAVGENLFELDIAGDNVREVDHPFGTIAQIARGSDGALYLATQYGAVMQSADGDFTQHTLSDGDNDGVAVSAVGYDSLSGAVFASDIGIVRLSDDVTSGVAPSASLPTNGLSIDFFGDVWLSHDQQLTGLFVGQPLSFDQAVLPVVNDHCVGCHNDPNSGAPLIDFADHQTAVNWSDRMVDRVTDPLNPMPPASMAPLAQEQIDAFVRWYATGTAP